MDARRLAALLLCLLSVGCTAVSREEMLQQVLQQDPAFEPLLTQRDAVQRDVEALRAELVQTRGTFRQRVEELEREFEVTRTQLNEQIATRLRELTQEREPLQLEHGALTQQIRIDEAAVRGFRATLSSLQRSLTASSQPPLSSAERQTRAARLQHLQADLQETETRLEQNRAQRQLLQYKLRLLRVR